MVTERQARLIEYLLQSDQIVQDLNIQTSYHRDVWDDLDRYVRQFLNGHVNQWLIMPGLRGVGKTTLLAQLYSHPALMADTGLQRFYLSFEKLALSGFSVNDLVEALRHLRHTHQGQAFLICLDEVHFDSQWSLGCKIIFDQIPQVLLVCTGSSALSLRLNPDSARRASVIKIHPLSFPEFVVIKQLNQGLKIWDQPATGLDRRLRHSLFDTVEPTAIYKSLQSYVDQIEAYYGAIVQNQYFNVGIEALMEEYIQGYGSLPFASSSSPLSVQSTLMGDAPAPVTQDMRDKILRSLNRTITDDVLKLLVNPGLGVGLRLQASTVGLLPKLVNILANSERISLRAIAKNIGGIQIKTLRSMLEILVYSDIIVEVPAIGGIQGKSTKTSKYLFSTPALRRALTLSPAGSGIDHNEGRRLRGSLLEDTVLMQLGRIFSRPSERRFIEYDSRAGAADFVITADGWGKNRIVVEVGYGKADARQVRQTLKAGGCYGLVISATDKFALDISNKVIYVPLKYFLLI